MVNSGISLKIFHIDHLVNYICIIFANRMTKPERTKQFIIEASAPIFNSKGIAGTVMQDIMDATKLAKGTLYHHFENREELAHAAVDYNLELWKGATNKVLKKHKTARGKIIGFLNLFSDPLNPPVFGGCPMLNFGTEADDTSPVVLAKVRKLVKEVQNSLKDIVNQGIADGEFRADWDAKRFAIKAFALMEGGTLISRITGSNAEMKIIVQIIKSEIEENSL